MSRSMLITRTNVEPILKRPGFYDKMPEFRQLRNVPEAKKSGCRSCRKNRAPNNKYRLFAAILSGLTEEAASRLKDYLNVQSLQYIGYNAQTRRTETITL